VTQDSGRAVFFSGPAKTDKQVMQIIKSEQMISKQGQVLGTLNQ
jgi:hypothetical protein